MRRLLLIILLLMSIQVNSQYLINKPETKPARIVLKEDGWFTISLGTTVLSSSYFIHYKYDTNGVKKEVIVGGLVFSTTIGIGLHLISWERKPVYNPKLRTSKML